LWPIILLIFFVVQRLAKLQTPWAVTETWQYSLRADHAIQHSPASRFTNPDHLGQSRTRIKKMMIAVAGDNQ